MKARTDVAESPAAAGGKKRKPRGRSGYRSDSSESDSDDDFQSSDREDKAPQEDQAAMWAKAGEYNVVFCTGPTGSGKTAGIRAVARELGYSVIESNAMDRRSGKAVLDMYGDGAQSHGLNKWNGLAVASSGGGEPAAAGKGKKRGAKVGKDPKPAKGKKRAKASGAGGNPSAGGGAGFFGGAKPSTRATAPLPDTELSRSSSSEKLSLIVFEEIDVLFEPEDRGFFAALEKLAGTTRRPIVLTANAWLPQALPALSVLHCPFETPRSTEVGRLVRAVLLAEGIALSHVDAKAMVRTYAGDYRAILLDLQLRLAGGGTLVPVRHCLCRGVFHCPRGEDAAFPSCSHCLRG